MDVFLRDLRYAARMLVASPGFTIVAVLALALGIGVNTAIFSVVDAVMLRPLPYADPDRLVFLQENSPKLEGMSVAYPNFVDWRHQNQVFEQLAARQPASFNLTAGSGEQAEPERIEGSNVSANLFATLGVQPMLGRAFTEAEDRPGAPRVAVLSHSFWQRRYNKDPNILGREIVLDDEPFTVIGVMPPEFRYPLTHLKGELWVSLGRNADRPGMKERGNHPGIYSVARVKQGVGLERARVEMDTIARRLERQYPDSNKDNRVGVYFLHERLMRGIRPAMLVVLSAVWFVLLIACANVANLLLARAATRQQEMAVRSAMGAGRARLVRQLLTESVLLAMAGGTLGLLLAYWGVQALVKLLPPNLPRLATVAVDTRILLFTLAVSLLTGLIFGLIPALQVSKQDLHESLKEGSRRTSGDARRQRVRSGLMIAEVALSLVLLIGAGLMMQSFLKLSQASPGFDSKNVLTLQIGLPASKYKEANHWTGFVAELLDRTRTLPGVRHVALVTPLLGGWQTGFTWEGRQASTMNDMILTDISRGTPGYFAAMGIPLLKGRTFTPADREGAPLVAIIDETLAKKHFPNEEPLGKKIRIGGAKIEWREVVGVVGHVKNYGIDQDSRVEMYLPYFQSPVPFMTMVVKTAGEPTALANPVRAEVLNIDRNQPVFNVVTMEQLAEDSMAAKRVAFLLLGIFAMAALVLSAVGLYGVISYSVTQRTQEFGIRLALGAGRGDVLRMVLRNGMRLVAIGLSLGLVASFGLMRLMSTLLYGVSATDPVTIAGVSALLTLVALCASYLPARRATKVDPIVALRYE